MKPEQTRIDLGPELMEVSARARVVLRELQEDQTVIGMADAVLEELAGKGLIERYPHRVDGVDVWVLTNRGRGHPT